jgi:hypothetical protein
MATEVILLMRQQRWALETDAILLEAAAKGHGNRSDPIDGGRRDVPWQQ